MLQINGKSTAKFLTSPLKILLGKQFAELRNCHAIQDKQFFREEVSSLVLFPGYIGTDRPEVF